jgi:molecular chaperone IbpA
MSTHAKGISISYATSNNTAGLATSGGTLTSFSGIDGNYTYTTNTIPAIHYGGSTITGSTVGWEKQLEGLEKVGERIIKNNGNFPPFNQVKVDDNTYLLEFALAGFSKKDIKVTQEKNALTIEGSVEEEDEREYIGTKGIATRSFTRTFALAEYVEVDSAEMKDGILTVTLTRNLPKEEQPKKITIK